MYVNSSSNILLLDTYFVKSLLSPTVLADSSSQPQKFFYGNAIIFAPQLGKSVTHTTAPNLILFFFIERGKTNVFTSMHIIIMCLAFLYEVENDFLVLSTYIYALM